MNSLGVLGIVLMLLCEGFFAGVETAFVTCNRVKISHLAGRGRWRAKLVQRLFNNPEWFLATTLLGVNVSVIAGSILTNRMVERFSDEWSFLISTAIMWPSALLAGEIIPKILFLSHADRAILLCILPVQAMSTLLFPVVYTLNRIGRSVAGVLAGGKAPEKRALSREEIRILVKEESELPTVMPEMRQMIEKIFDFKSRTVGQVMVPMDQVVTAQTDAQVGDIREIMRSSGHSRVPLYVKGTRRIVGYVRAVDLVGRSDREPALPLVQEPLLTQEPQFIGDLLPQFRTTGRHLALVLNIRSEPVGILTLEDVMEEIVGEIEDEFD